MTEQKMPSMMTPVRRVNWWAGVGLVMLTGVLLSLLILAITYYADNQRLDGYRQGNEDGYSIGYRDGMAGVEPDQHRFMEDADYDLRAQIGGRARGE